MSGSLKTDDLSTFIDNCQVIYIRHIMDSDEKVYGELISNHIAATNYGILKPEVDKTQIENYLTLDNYDLTKYKNEKRANFEIETIKSLDISLYYFSEPSTCFSIVC